MLRDSDTFGLALGCSRGIAPNPTLFVRESPVVRAGSSSPRRIPPALALALLAAACTLACQRGPAQAPTPDLAPPDRPVPNYQPRRTVDSGGFQTAVAEVRPWPDSASLEEIAGRWRGLGPRLIAAIDAQADHPAANPGARLFDLLVKAAVCNYEGDPRRAYAVLGEARAKAEADPDLAAEWLYTVVYFQGVTALRSGETDNCVLCRGAGSCILPIAPTAVHANPTGSRLAVGHFTEYLDRFPDDAAVRWLLNVAHMTLGEHPDRVDPRYLVRLDRLDTPGAGIGRFRDVGHLVGLNRLNQAGGAILDDFDNDGLLDVVFTSMDPATPMAFYRNKGDGTFEDRTRPAGLLGQLGGLNCVQADYDNDGHLDIFVVRGAWLASSIRPSLLRNNGDSTFSDVTHTAGLDAAINSIAAQWADFDNDGHLDLFVCCEQQPSRLYRNRGNGTFEEVAAAAKVAGRWGQCAKGCAWLDYDADGYPDLFVNDLAGTAQLFHNEPDPSGPGGRRFRDATTELGIDGPRQGFSCWAFDYDNDGWPDLFATSYDRSLEDAIRGLTGQPHGRQPSKLYRNLAGKGFRDVTREAGLDLVLITMGSNFGDFDNDGYPDFYLGTGDAGLETLVPNRMFHNMGGTRFAEITGSSGTGHLQKGHGVACGDWDRNGTVDLVVETGGAVPGDRYHSVLFQNPGQANRSLTVRLIGSQTAGGTGRKTNRSAIGARIKVETAGPEPRTVYRHVCSGSSFGANPLEQTIGVGRADRVARLEVYWPATGITQAFQDVPTGGYIEITEGEPAYRVRQFKPIPLPAE